jgi:hypothetical protein
MAGPESAIAEGAIGEGAIGEGAIGDAGERSTRFPSLGMPGLAQPGAAPSKRIEASDIAQPPEPPGALRRPERIPGASPAGLTPRVDDPDNEITPGLEIMPGRVIVPLKAPMLPSRKRRAIP